MKQIRIEVPSGEVNIRIDPSDSLIVTATEKYKGSDLTLPTTSPEMPIPPQRLIDLLAQATSINT